MRAITTAQVRATVCGKNRGFSLFELIVVIVVISIATALTIPAVQSGWESRQIRQGTRKLAAVMRGLREQAVRRGVEQELVLEPDGQTIRWSENREGSLPEGVAIVGVRGGWRDEDGRVRAVFYPNGGTTGLGVIVAAQPDENGREKEEGLRFTIDVDPLLGSVVIQEVTKG